TLETITVVVLALSATVSVRHVGGRALLVRCLGLFGRGVGRSSVGLDVFAVGLAVRGLGARALCLGARGLRAPLVARRRAVGGGGPLGEQALGALALRAQIAIDGPQQALRLAAVVLGQGRVGLVADLADRALVLEIFQGAQHGPLLLLLGARRAQADRLLQG